MADAIYPKAKERMLTAVGVNWSTGVVKAVLLDISTGANAYTYGSTHEFRTEVHDDAHIATSAALDGKTITDGVADANDVTFSAVSSTRQVGAILLYLDKSAKADDQLIAFVDSATGLPVTPNGGDIKIEWDNGASKIFAL